MPSRAGGDRKPARVCSAPLSLDRGSGWVAVSSGGFNQTLAPKAQGAENNPGSNPVNNYLRFTPVVSPLCLLACVYF